jgi:flagellar protein FlaG
MEVRNISQGGQTSVDNISINRDSSKSIPNVIPSTPNVEPAINKDAQGKNSSISEKELKKALDKLTGFLADDNTSVEYKYHDKFTNDLMITIVDKTTKEVILEVPPKKILDLVAKMMEMVGVLFDKKA